MGDVTADIIISALKGQQRSHPKAQKLSPAELASINEVLQQWKAVTAAADAKAKAAKEVKPILRRIGIHLLDQWKENVDSTIAIAPLPADEATQKYWWIALAGNLIWASTVYMSAGGTALITASFGGAVVGSGVMTPKDDIQDGRNLVRQTIAEMRGALEEEVDKALGGWSRELIENMPQYKDIPDFEGALEVWMWHHLFSDIPFDAHRFRKIGDIAFTNITRALQVYNSNFDKWRHSIARRGFSYKYGVQDAWKLVPFNADLGSAVGRPGMRIVPPPKGNRK